MKDLLSSLRRGCVFFLKVVRVVVSIALLGLLFPLIIMIAPLIMIAIIYLVGEATDYMDFMTGRGE